MAENPYIKWWTSDFLNGVIDLTAEEIGVYAVLLALIADRGGPIADDPQWLARRCGTTTRGFNRIRDRLMDAGKIERRNGLLGNRRMLAEVTERDRKSKQATAAAKAKWAKWHEDQSPTLPFEDGNAEVTGEKQPEKLGENRQKNRPVKTGKPQKTDDPDVRTHISPSRARARPEPELESDNQSNEDSKTDGGDENDADRSVVRGGKGLGEGADPDSRSLFDRVCDAAGYNPIQPGHIAKAHDQIRAWRDAGIDFDLIVIPTIKAVIANSDDPTSSLIRFDKRIRHQHAKQGATPASMSYKPPASPITDQPGEEDCFNAVRADLLKAFGPTTFSRYVNAVLFETVPDAPQDRRIMRVIDKRAGPMVLMDDQRATTVRQIARKHGFDDVW